MNLYKKDDLLFYFSLINCDLLLCATKEYIQKTSAKGQSCVSLCETSVQSAMQFIIALEYEPQAAG